MVYSRFNMSNFSLRSQSRHSLITVLHSSQWNTTCNPTMLEGKPSLENLWIMRSFGLWLFLRSQTCVFLFHFYSRFTVKWHIDHRMREKAAYFWVRVRSSRFLSPVSSSVAQQGTLSCGPVWVFWIKHSQRKKKIIATSVASARGKRVCGCASKRFSQKEDRWTVMNIMLRWYLKPRRQRVFELV